MLIVRGSPEKMPAAAHSLGTTDIYIPAPPITTKYHYTQGWPDKMVLNKMVWTKW